MRLSVVFAFRYVFSKKKTTAINIISGITAIAFSVGAAAMIIVLSALNGFEQTLTSLFTAFDPMIKVEIIKGKTFTLESNKFNSIKAINGIEHVALVLEDNAVVKYGESQEIAIIKGVSDNYNKVTKIDSTIVEGKFQLGHSTYDEAVFGYELTNKLGVNISNPVGFVTIYVPKKGIFSNLNPEENLTIERVLPVGSFFVQEDIDSRYIITSLAFARKLFGSAHSISAIEIAVNKGTDVNSVQQKLKKLLGPKFIIKNQYQQKESIYKIFKSEKLTTFGILSFILLIAAFNMTGALTMLIIEKEKDITILKSIGFKKIQIQKIFITSGLIISILGSILGLIIGGTVCWLQLKFALLRIENSVVEAYPVTINFMDFVFVLIISLIIGYFTAWIPAKKIK